MEVADTEFKRALGLMFRRGGEMLFIFEEEVKLPVWTPFMFFPLDLFFLDRNKKLTEVKRNLVPWRIYAPKKPYRYFFESAAGKCTEKIVVSRIKKKLN